MPEIYARKSFSNFLSYGTFRKTSGGALGDFGTRIPLSQGRSPLRDTSMQGIYELYELFYATLRDAVKIAQFLGCSAPSRDFYWRLLHASILLSNSED